MAVLQISLAPTAAQSQIPTAKQDTSTFPDAMQSQMSRSDRPDPGGGPPARTAKRGATNLGPNAQSNKPDPSSQPAKAPAVNSADPSVQSSSVDGTTTVAAATADSTTAALPSSSTGKASKTPKVDPTLLAMLVSSPNAAVVVPTVNDLAAQSTSAASSTVASSAAIDAVPQGSTALTAVVAVSANEILTSGNSPAQSPAVASKLADVAATKLTSSDAQTNSKTVPTLVAATSADSALKLDPTGSPAGSKADANPQAATIDPTPQASSPADAQTVAVVVDRSAIQATPRSLSVIPNATVANSANADNSNLTVADVVSIAMPQAATAGQDSFGAPGDGKNSQPGPSTPDLTTAGASGVAPQATQVSATAPTQAVALPDSQRLDVVRQAANHIELAAAARAPQGVTVHLSPQGMGDLTVVVKGVGKDIEATISASNVAVRNALTDSKDSLNQAITAKGFNLVGVSVTTHSQSANPQNRQSSPNPQTPQDLARQAGGHSNSNSSQRGPNSLNSGGLNNRVDAEPELTHVSAAKDGVDYLI